MGDLTSDGSGSKYDGVAKKASVAFTDIFYEVNATRLCYCLSSATCSPNAADQDYDGMYSQTLPTANRSPRSPWAALPTGVEPSRVRGRRRRSGVHEVR